MYIHVCTETFFTLYNVITMDLLLVSTIPFAQETLSSSLNALLVNLFMWLLSLNCVLFKVNLF